MIVSRHIHNWIIFTLAFLFCSGAGAYSDGYGPYQEEENPKVFPCQSLTELPRPQVDDPISQPFEFKSPENFIVRFSQVAEKNSLYEEACLLDSNGKKLARARGLEYPMWGCCALEGDFNKDGKPDFALMLGNGGNGLAAERGQWVFFLSKGSSYKALVLDTDSIGMNDLLDIGKDGCLRVVHTSLVESPDDAKVDESQRRDLYFRIYRLLKVVGIKLVPDISTDLRFPKSVAFMKWGEQQNHKETKLISPKEKQELIKKNPVPLRQGADVLKGSPK